MAKTIKKREGAYVRAGVNYRELDPFKAMMRDVARQTRRLPEHRGVMIDERGGIVISKAPVVIKDVTEGLGNKNWVVDFLTQTLHADCRLYEGMAIDTLLMAINDVIPIGALPIAVTLHIACGDGIWFTSGSATALGQGFLRGCQMFGIALTGGETPALRYLIKPEPPVKYSPVLSCTVTGIIDPPEREIPEDEIQIGDSIIGVGSSGPHCNGYSLLIKLGLALPDGFTTKVPGTNNSYADEILRTTISYVALIEALLDRGIVPHAVVPGTGDGLRRLTRSPRQYNYRIHSWPKIAPIFQFVRDQGISDLDCATTFNLGIGCYLFVPREMVNNVCNIGTAQGYEMMEIGRVEKGKRTVFFDPWDLSIPALHK